MMSDTDNILRERVNQKENLPESNNNDEKPIFKGEYNPNRLPESLSTSKEQKYNKSKEARRRIAYNSSNSSNLVIPIEPSSFQDSILQKTKVLEKNKNLPDKEEQKNQERLSIDSSVWHPKRDDQNCSLAKKSKDSGTLDPEEKHEDDRTLSLLKQPNKEEIEGFFEDSEAFQGNKEVSIPDESDSFLFNEKPGPEEFEDVVSKSKELKAKGDKEQYLGDDQQALAYYVEASSLDPTNYDLYLDQSEILIKLKRREDADKLYDKAIELRRGDATAYHRKANNLSELGKDKEAMEAYNEAIKLAPNNPEIIIHKAMSLRDLGRKQEAKELFERGLSFPLNSFPNFNTKAIAEAALGRLEEAVNSYELAIKADPGNHVFYNNKTVALTRLKRYEEALQCINLAIGFNQKYRRSYHNKGVVLIGLKRYDEALEALDKALTLGPEYYGLYIDKGYALRKQGELQEAMKWYDKSIELNPDGHLAYNNKAEILLDLGRYKEALVYIDRALRIDRDDSCYFETKGRALYNLDRKQKALRFFNKALDMEPNNSFYLFNRGKCLYDIGKVEEAVKDFEELDHGVEETTCSWIDDISNEQMSFVNSVLDSAHKRKSASD